MKTSNLRQLLFLATALLLIAAGCTGAKAISLEGSEREQFLAKADPIADNLLQGMNEHNYAMFSRDFDAAMKKSLNEAAFNQMMQSFDTKLGKYQSRQVTQAEKSGNYTAAIYQAKYEKEDVVTIRLVLNGSETAQVTGLWFNSAKLRSQ